MCWKLSRWLWGIFSHNFYGLQEVKTITVLLTIGTFRVYFVFLDISLPWLIVWSEEATCIDFSFWWASSGAWSWHRGRQVFLLNYYFWFGFCPLYWVEYRIEGIFFSRCDARCDRSGLWFYLSSEICRLSVCLSACLSVCHGRKLKFLSHVRSPIELKFESLLYLGLHTIGV
jgi:hypothetical protein